jgi:hypothetical protein
MPVEADLEPLVFAPPGDRTPEVEEMLARIDEALEEAQPSAE